MSIEAKCVEFTKWVIRESLEGLELDASTIQDRARAMGLTVVVPYDPATHGENEYDVQPRDVWTEFSAALKATGNNPAQPTAE
jgi:hypothetical protein